MSKEFKPKGLASEHLEFIMNRLNSVLKSRSSAKVYCFGSRAIGTERKYSDLDLWIEASPDLTDSEIAKLKDAFLESDLPIKIDIVTPKTCLPDFLHNIEKSKKLWYET